MEWKHPNEHMEDENEIQNHHDSHEKSVIKKLQGNALGLPVGKLVNNTNELHSPHLGYTTRMPQMQSILTIRPDQYRQTGTPLSNLPHSLLNRESVIQPRPVSANGRTKANSVESPQEKSDEELIEPGSPDKPYLPINHEEKSAENAMDVDESKVKFSCFYKIIIFEFLVSLYESDWSKSELIRSVIFFLNKILALWLRVYTQFLIVHHEILCL